jgi:hypothetical protein
VNNRDFCGKLESRDDLAVGMTNLRRNISALGQPKGKTAPLFQADGGSGGISLWKFTGEKAGGLYGNLRIANAETL